MKRPTELDLEEIHYPPFQGFPKETFVFLKKLKKNNSREWFQPRKTEYEEVVKFPMQCLIHSLGAILKPSLPNYSFNPKKSVFRINRDVRFSKDKSPYKTNIAASFNLMIRPTKTTEQPGLYLHIEPKSKDGWGNFAGGGLYMPDSQQLKVIRAAMINQSDVFFNIVRNKTFIKYFGGIQGERLKTSPKGYDVNHPMIDYLKHKQFFVSRSFDEEDCLKPTFVKLVADTFLAQIPFINFLNASIDMLSPENPKQQKFMMNDF